MKTLSVIRVRIGEDLGFYRAYFQEIGTKKLYALQKDFPHIYNWYTVTRDGEPIDKLLPEIRLKLMDDYVQVREDRKGVKKTNQIVFIPDVGERVLWIDRDFNIYFQAHNSWNVLKPGSQVQKQNQKLQTFNQDIKEGRCPFCKSKLVYYHGVLGYEAMRCPNDHITIDNAGIHVGGNEK